MTSLGSWLRGVNPFNFADSIKIQEEKDRRIKRLEKVNGFVEQRVDRRKNYLIEHAQALEETVRNALDGFDQFKGKDDE